MHSVTSDTPCLLLGNVEAKLAWPRHLWFLGTVLLPWPWASVEVKTINPPRAPQEPADLLLKTPSISFPLSLQEGEGEAGREGDTEGEEDVEWQERQRQGECAAHTQTQRVVTDRRTRKRREQQRDRRHKETERDGQRGETQRETKRKRDETHPEKQR